jgi:hypothetical protein
MRPTTILLAAVMLAASQSALAIGALADLTVYDRAAARALPVHWGQGGAYIAGQPGDEYSIRVSNRAAVDILAVVSVDGVNVVTGETASAAQSGYVIPAGGSVEVRGWRKSLQRIAAFYFTDLGDSYAARTGRPDDVGVIGVAVFKAKPPEPLWIDPQPRGELQQRRSQDSPRERADSGAGSSNAAGEKTAPAPALGTGHGRSESSPARRVQFERETPTPNEVIVLRYDSRENLIALGILPPSRRPPRPFPASFVPDPPALH